MDIVMKHEVQKGAGLLDGGVCAVVMIMGNTHCMKLIVAVCVAVTVMVMVVAMLMDMLVAVSYTVMSMLVAVCVRMLMAVIAVKTFVHSCLLSAEKGQTGALLHIGTSYLRYYIYFFPFNQL